MQRISHNQKGTRFVQNDAAFQRLDPSLWLISHIYWFQRDRLHIAVTTLLQQRGELNGEINHT